MKSSEKGQKRAEYLGEKLKLGLRMREKGGVETPVAPPWKLWSEQANDQSLRLPLPSLSARKLAATLSDIHPYIPRSNVQVHRYTNSSSSSSHSGTSSADCTRRSGGVSSSSYGSSSEVERYKQGMDEEQVGSGYDLRTSSELLKVLNRIWRLEEQHESSLSLVRTLRKELEEAREQIKELITDRREILKQKQVKSALQSLKDELDDERKLRRQSGSLHRKLARELAEVRSSLSNATMDLEREQRSRILLEDLCDLFAEKVRDDEQELAVRRKREDWIEKSDRDRLILNISESWLDERIQATGKNSFAENLRSEIQILLNLNRSSNIMSSRRNSLESIAINQIKENSSGTEEDKCDSSRFLQRSPSDWRKLFAINQIVEDNDKSDDDDVSRLNSRSNSKITSRNSHIFKRSASDCRKLLAINQILEENNDSPGGEEKFDRSNSKLTARSSLNLQRSPSDCRKSMQRSTSDGFLDSSSKMQAEENENSLKAKLLEERSRSRMPSRFSVFRKFV